MNIIHARYDTRIDAAKVTHWEYKEWPNGQPVICVNAFIGEHEYRIESCHFKPLTEEDAEEDKPNPSFDRAEKIMRLMVARFDFFMQNPVDERFNGVFDAAKELAAYLKQNPLK